MLLFAGIIGSCLALQTKMQRENRVRTQEVAAERGAKSVSQLSNDGEHYVVSGYDLHNIAGDLIGKKIRFEGTITKIELVPSHRAEILSKEQCYYVQLNFGDILGENIPTDLSDQFVKNGLQRGDKITLWCSIFMLAKDEGITALAHRSCIVNDVDRWERGNVSSGP